MSPYISLKNEEKTNIRVITDDRFYSPGGPVLFYTGNEGAIQLFCENTGFMREAASLLNAKIVFMEHRPGSFIKENFLKK
jgi:lysosomal Pro-X carboxypeptidase